MKCPICGKEISPNASLCPNCGEPINRENKSSQEKQGANVKYEVFLKSTKMKITMIKINREVTGNDLKEAMEVVEHLPCRFVVCNKREEAEAVVKLIQEKDVHAVVEIKEVDEMIPTTNHYNK